MSLNSSLSQTTDVLLYANIQNRVTQKQNTRSCTHTYMWVHMKYIRDINRLPKIIELLQK